MSRHLTINGSVVGGGRGPRGGNGREAAAIRSYNPVYQYSTAYTVPLERLRWWPETQELVGVYMAQVYVAHLRKYMPERFIIAYRNGSFVELKQFLAPGVYHRQRLG